MPLTVKWVFFDLGSTLIDETAAADARRIKEMIRVELAEPRNRNSYEFLEIRRKVYAQFFSSDEIQQDYVI